LQPFKAEGLVELISNAFDGEVVRHQHSRSPFIEKILAWLFEPKDRTSLKWPMVNLLNSVPVPPDSHHFPSEASLKTMYFEEFTPVVLSKVRYSKGAPLS